MIAQSQAKSKSEKFPPAHEDGVVGFPMEPSRPGQGSSMLRPSRHLVPTTLVSQSVPMGSSMPARGVRRKKKMGEDGRMAPPRPPSRSSSRLNTTDFSQSGDFSNMASVGASRSNVSKSNLRPEVGDGKPNDPHIVDHGQPAREHHVLDPTMGSKPQIDMYPPKQELSPAG